MHVFQLVDRVLLKYLFAVQIQSHITLSFHNFLGIFIQLLGLNEISTGAFNKQGLILKKNVKQITVYCLHENRLFYIFFRCFTGHL
jgi:hypothetical protein